MRRARAAVLGAWLLLALPPAEARAQTGAPAPVIERIEIVNNQFLQKETLLFDVSTKPGDRFDESRLREDFRRLWDTGFLDDMRLDVFDTAGGKTVVFTVKERRRVQIVGSYEKDNFDHFNSLVFNAYPNC